MKKKIRPYISTGITFAFVILTASGIALYCAPSCREARMTGWQFLFLSKDSWEAFHMVFAIFFLILGILHIYLNWEILITYLSNKKKKVFSPALIVTAAVTLLFLLLSVMKVPPVNWLTNLNDQFKRGNSARQYQESSHRGRGKGRGRYRQFRKDQQRDYPGSSD